jgi:amidase
LHTELKADLNAYLAATPPAVKARSLAAIIAFNREHAAEEMPLFAQETFEISDKAPTLPMPNIWARGQNRWPCRARGD